MLQKETSLLRGENYTAQAGPEHRTGPGGCKHSKWVRSGNKRNLATMGGEHLAVSNSAKLW